METDGAMFTINLATFDFTSNMEDCDIISNAISRYAKIIKLDDSALVDENLSRLRSLYIDVSDGQCPGYPQMNMDESCMWYRQKIVGCTQRI